MDSERLPRRQALQLVASATVAGLAGCRGDSTETASPGSSPTDRTPTATATPGPEPEPDGETTPTPVPPATVAEWVSDECVPLGTTDPSVTPPVDPLTDVLSDARIVGMGEATHGTREFFDLKHRLLRFLVEELGYRVFAWEAGFSQTLRLDEYITGEDVDPVAALDTITHWAWNSREVLSMVEWLRSFNAGRSRDDQVRFYGFDVQTAADPAERLRSYLETVGETAGDDLLSDLSMLAEEGFDEDVETPVDERLTTAEQLVEELETLFDRDRESLVAATSEREYRLARRHLRTLELASEYEAAERIEGGNIRDRGMADTVDWILDHENADHIALWAHNAHVWTHEEDVTRMGTHLRERHGDEYYRLGFEFDRGSFRSLAMSDGDITEYTVEGADDESASRTLSAVDDSPFLLGFAALDNPDLRAWLDQPRPFHYIGSVFDSTWGWPQYTDDLNPMAVFDGLIFVEESSPTRPIPEEGRGGDDRQGSDTVSKAVSSAPR